MACKDLYQPVSSPCEGKSWKYIDGVESIECKVKENCDDLLQVPSALGAVLDWQTLS